MTQPPADSSAHHVGFEALAPGPTAEILSFPDDHIVAETPPPVERAQPQTLKELVDEIWADESLDELLKAEMIADARERVRQEVLRDKGYTKWSTTPTPPILKRPE